MRDPAFNVVCDDQAAVPDTDAAAEEAAEPAPEGDDSVMEDAAGAGEEAPAQAMEEDSADDDWETMDVDAITLPSQAEPEQVTHASSATSFWCESGGRRVVLTLVCLGSA